MAYVKLSLASLAPAALCILFYYLKRKTVFGSYSDKKQQIIYGITFGVLSIIGTEMGIPYMGAQLNCRDAAVLTAGLMFGAPAGIIAGCIGSVERWFSIYWGIGYFTREACSISTFIAGIYAAILRKRMFEDRRPEWHISLAIGVVMEVFHLSMILFTNMDTPYEAIEVVKACNYHMIIANSVSVMLSGMVLSILDGSFSLKSKKKDNIHISQIIQRWLLVAVIFAFAATTYLGIKLQSTIAVGQINAVMKYASPKSYMSVRRIMNTTKSIAIVANIYSEILVFAVMFAAIYVLLKIVVVNQIRKVNDRLENITAGNLDVIVDVNSNKEFSNLSKDINSTVDTLKQYIQEASARIDKELEVARDIQLSSLPGLTLPKTKKHGFDIFADIHTAKEVGGDFYDFYTIDNNSIDFTIADVSGKGIPAAMFMMRAKIELNKQCSDKESLSRAFTDANNALCEGNDAEMFITACHCRTDLNTGVMTIVNAGHNPLIIKRKDGSTEYVKVRPGFVLAGMKNMVYKETTIQLQKGDIVFAYTDGVTEATNFAEQMFGEDRLLKVVSDYDGTDMELLCRKVKEAIDLFAKGVSQYDDITMVAFRYGDEEKNKESDIRFFENTTLETIREMTDYVEEELKRLGCTTGLAVKFKIAIDEIVSNILKYGYKEHQGPVWIRTVDNTDDVGFIISDSSVPFNPLLQKDPDVNAPIDERQIGGLGLYMVKKSMDKVDYCYQNGKNNLTILKSIKS